jgi:hypothetical protein
MNPTDPMVTSLDNYFSPKVGYDLHFNENNFAIGFRLGATYEIGNSSKEFNEIKITSEDIRNSYFGEIRFAYNALNLNNSYIQLAGGLRFGQIYYQKQEMDIFGGTYTLEADNASIPTLDYVLAIAYQYNFNKRKLFSKHHLAFRFALDMLYMRPRQNFGSSDYVKYSSIALGPSVSLVWRINGKRNGLY